MTAYRQTFQRAVLPLLAGSGRSESEAETGAPSLQGSPSPPDRPERGLRRLKGTTFRSNIRSGASRAHIVRAILLASATMATFLGRRDSSPCSHGGTVRPGRLAWVSTARAPWISRVRRYGSPRLLMPRSLTFPPVPDWRGTGPRKAANSRPERNVRASPHWPQSRSSSAVLLRESPRCAGTAHPALGRADRALQLLDAAGQLPQTLQLLLQLPADQLGNLSTARIRQNRAACTSSARQLLGTTTPNSYSSPRTWFACIVRCFTSCARMRCNPIRACCCSPLRATKRISGRCAASQIAWASAASVLLLLTNGRTNCAEISRTWCPRAFNARPQ